MQRMLKGMICASNVFWLCLGDIIACCGVVVDVFGRQLEARSSEPVNCFVLPRKSKPLARSREKIFGVVLENGGGIPWLI